VIVVLDGEEGLRLQELEGNPWLPEMNVWL
jgi:hypothetical protein